MNLFHHFVILVVQQSLFAAALVDEELDYEPFVFHELLVICYYLIVGLVGFAQRQVLQYNDDKIRLF